MATLLPCLRNVEHHLAGVPGTADQTDGGSRILNPVVRTLRHWQRAVCREFVHLVQQLVNLVSMGDTHQPEVDGVEREVAPEREQSEPGVTVYVALADLDEAPSEGQQVESGRLRCTRQGVEHDVDAVPVGVTADLVGELDAARVVDVFDTHVLQQLSTLRAACRREDLGSCGTSYRDGRLPHAAGPGVDEHLVGRRNPGQIVQAVPRSRVCGGHGGRLGV